METQENKINPEVKESQNKNEIIQPIQSKSEIPQNEIKENPQEQNRKIFPKPNERKKTKVNKNHII